MIKQVVHTFSVGTRSRVLSEHSRPGVLTLLGSLAIVILMSVKSALAVENGEYIGWGDGEELPFSSAPNGVWTTSIELTALAEEYLVYLQAIENEGLPPERYHRSELLQLVSVPVYAYQLDRIEALLDKSFRRLITDLSRGHINPALVQSRWFQRADPINASDAYRALETDSHNLQSVLQQFRPQWPGYMALSKALERYREIASHGGWPTIADGALLKPGMYDDRVPQIAMRLRIGGDLQSSRYDMYKTYNERLANAVRRFQRRHGLHADGIVGKATLAALNIPVEKRISELAANLERYRWMPNKPGNRYIVTNVADYSLALYEDNTRTLDMPVIVGEPDFKTPIFSDEIEWLVFDPTWTVPKSIMYRKLLPKEQKESGYLARNNYELISTNPGYPSVTSPDDIEPEQYKTVPFPYTLRQKPGPGNALGKVKFILPNTYNIYLHDTPGRSLFQRKQRAFSNGCIRLSQPDKLATALLGYEGWTPDKISKIRERGSNQRILLRQHVPNHIVYLTNWVDESGQLQRRPDIYDHDPALISAIEKQATKYKPAESLATASFNNPFTNVHDNRNDEDIIWQLY